MHIPVLLFRDCIKVLLTSKSNQKIFHVCFTVVQVFDKKCPVLLTKKSNS